MPTIDKHVMKCNSTWVPFLDLSSNRLYSMLFTVNSHKMSPAYIICNNVFVQNKLIKVYDKVDI